MNYETVQKERMKALFQTTFKEHYDLIPESYKNIYFFKKMLLELGDLLTKIKIQSDLGIYKYKCDIVTKKIDGDIITSIEIKQDNNEYFSYKIILSKNGMIIITLDSFKNSQKTKKELVINSESNILVNYYIQNEEERSLSSIFDNSGVELERISTYYLGKKLIRTDEFKKIEGLNKEISDLTIPNNKSLYLVRISSQVGIKYAICFKDDGYLDESYQKSFQGIIDFEEIEKEYINIISPCVFEISEDTYNTLLGAPDVQRKREKKD